jgi:hypothetical protein
MINHKIVNVNKAKSINTLNKWINKIVPLLNAELLKGYKLNDGFMLSKKDKPRFDALMKTTPFRARLVFNNYSVMIECDITYKTDEFGCNYYKESVYLFNTDKQEFEPVELKKVNWTGSQIDKIAAKITKLNDQLFTIACDISYLKRSIGL